MRRASLRRRALSVVSIIAGLVAADVWTDPVDGFASVTFTADLFADGLSGSYKNFSASYSFVDSNGTTYMPVLPFSATLALADAALKVPFVRGADVVNCWEEYTPTAFPGLAPQGNCFDDSLLHPDLLADRAAGTEVTPYILACHEGTRGVGYHCLRCNNDELFVRIFPRSGKATLTQAVTVTVASTDSSEVAHAASITAVSSSAVGPVPYLTSLDADADTFAPNATLKAVVEESDYVARRACLADTVSGMSWMFDVAAEEIDASDCGLEADDADAVAAGVFALSDTDTELSVSCAVTSSLGAIFVLSSADDRVQKLMPSPLLFECTVGCNTTMYALTATDVATPTDQIAVFRDETLLGAWTADPDGTGPATAYFTVAADTVLTLDLPRLVTFLGTASATLPAQGLHTVTVTITGVAVTEA
jgi:hypothetical protein